MSYRKYHPSVCTLNLFNAQNVSMETKGLACVLDSVVLNNVDYDFMKFVGVKRVSDLAPGFECVLSRATDHIIICYQDNPCI